MADVGKTQPRGVCFSKDFSQWTTEDELQGGNASDTLGSLKRCIMLRGTVMGDAQELGVAISKEAHYTKTRLNHLFPIMDSHLREIRWKCGGAVGATAQERSCGRKGGSWGKEEPQL